VLIERWRVHLNTIRPDGALAYRPTASETAFSKPLMTGVPLAA
jgi:hypothetical protein